MFIGYYVIWIIVSGAAPIQLLIGMNRVFASRKKISIVSIVLGNIWLVEFTCK